MSWSWTATPESPNFSPSTFTSGFLPTAFLNPSLKASAQPEPAGPGKVTTSAFSPALRLASRPSPVTPPLAAKSTAVAAGRELGGTGFVTPTTGMPLALASSNFLISPAPEMAPTMMASAPLATQSSNCDNCLGRLS